jgi:uncharacterized protein (TIGR03545 family)
MKKWIRWWGLIAFAVIAALLTVFWLFFVDGIVRRVVERTGTAIAGAEVDVDRARLALTPFGLSLNGIQVTDPKNPSTNAIEISRIGFSLDALNLLRRKVIIQEMSAEGVRFGTARKKPGLVAARDEKKPTEKKPSSFALPSFEMPDVKKILETEAFGSVKLIDDAKADIQNKRDGWQKRVAELPNRAAVDAYRSRIDKLKASSRSSLQDLAGAAGDAKKIKDDLERDLDRVRQSREALNADLSSAKNLVAKAEQAPLDDVRRIRDKYSLSPSGIQNMSQALFGGKVTSWLDSGLLWYNRLSPLLARSVEKKGNVKIVKPVRGKGVDVKFPERNPLPDFLIGNVKASLQPEAGSFDGTIRNITTDQDILGMPLTFQFDGSGMKDVRALTLSGALDHIQPARFHDTINVQANGYRADNMVLSSSKELPISLQDGLLDIDVKGLRGPEGLRATLATKFRSVHIITGSREGGGMILTSLRSALSRVSDFSLFADITGEPGNYDVKVSSDLDRVFKDAIGRIVQEQSSRLEKELKTAVQAKTDEKLKDLKASLGGLNSIGGNIDGVQNQLNGLLKEVTQSAGGKIKLPF